MIPENSRSTVSFSSFLVYFSTYIIILQENIGILFENLFKPRQLHLAVLQVLPAASFLVCSLIFIEYKQPILFLPSNKTDFESDTILTFPVASD